MGGIHGDKSQRSRSETLQRFKEGSCNVMIATDVAARGLDINDIEWVVNYDFPLDIENYIHRIGRTGRASRKGSSMTYITSDECRYAKKLKKILIESNQKVPDELLDLEEEENRAKSISKRVPTKSAQRYRNYGYRGMGRDDGDRYEETDFSHRRRSSSKTNYRSENSYQTGRSL